jgi:hypothetical protein
MVLLVAVLTLAVAYTLNVPVKGQRDARNADLDITVAHPEGTCKHAACAQLQRGTSAHVCIKSYVKGHQCAIVCMCI